MGTAQGQPCERCFAGCFLTLDQSRGVDAMRGEWPCSGWHAFVAGHPRRQRPVARGFGDHGRRFRKQPLARAPRDACERLAVAHLLVRGHRVGSRRRRHRGRRGEQRSLRPALLPSRTPATGTAWHAGLCRGFLRGVASGDHGGLPGGHIPVAPRRRRRDLGGATGRSGGLGDPARLGAQAFVGQRRRCRVRQVGVQDGPCRERQVSLAAFRILDRLIQVAARWRGLHHPKAAAPGHGAGSEAALRADVGDPLAGWVVQLRFQHCGRHDQGDGCRPGKC
mmetsp:Transcript_101513/g.291319  ORF Transcript_101513/g.291319 Transcript_101513/m.291319 type:complete len:279 (+) Transcript_101513:2342-3178(+)